MTAETTQPIVGQRGAVQVLADLMDQHPQLPGAYITIHRPWRSVPARFDLQLETPTDFEQWRTVLGISPMDVDLHFHGPGSWVQVEAPYRGIGIVLSSHGIRLTEAEATAPRERDEVTA